VPQAFIGIGSNLGDRAAQIRRALSEISTFSRRVRVSAFRETEPFGVDSDQPDYLNAVASIETDLNPRDLLEHLLEIERRMGRVRTVHGASREIDLDLLAYEDRVMEEPGLYLPHPRMTERRFVLEPLAEVAPEWVHPIAGKTATELLSQLVRTNER
jgi:2-amino-4-hydroxy-6-hydroxymethyldihydropteridine diphosphokinase